MHLVTIESNRLIAVGGWEKNVFSEYSCTMLLMVIPRWWWKIVIERVCYHVFSWPPSPTPPPPPRGVPPTNMTFRLAQKMLFVGKVVRVLRQTKVANVNLLSLPGPSALSSSSSSSSDLRPRDSYSRLLGASTGDGNGRGDGGGGGDGESMGVSEAEVLELTQRWSELCDREAFHLLALERAVHEVRERQSMSGCGGGRAAMRLGQRY